MMPEQFKGEYYMEYIRENMKYNLNSDTFCGQILSLKCQTLSKVSAKLWLDHLGQDNLRFRNSRNFHCKLKVFRKKIVKKISHFLIPLNCKKDLEQMCDIIEKELTFHFAHYGVSLSYASLDEVNIFRDICWTPQGTINKVKTAAKIIEHTTLSTKDKYALACRNCLEEHIRELIKTLPEDFLIDYENDEYFLLQFWAFYVRGEQEKLSKLTMGKEIWVYLLKQTTRYPFVVAVQYVFENFVKREKINESWIEFLFGSIRQQYNNSSMYLYLWQEFPEIQRCMMNVGMNKQFLLKIHHISKFCSVPPLAEYVHETIKHFNVCDAFELILFCWREKMIDVQQYITFWNRLTLDFKVDFDEKFLEIYELIMEPRTKGNILDFLTVKLLIRKYTLENLKFILMNTKGRFCRYVICYGGPVFFDNLLCQVLKDKSKIYEFKNEFFNSHGLSTIAELITLNKFEWIEELIDKFCAPKKLNQFKNDLPYLNNSLIIYYIKLDTYKYNFDYLTVLDNFLNWQFKGSKEEICRCTSTIFDLEIETDSYYQPRNFFFDVVRHLIIDENWELVERYWKWIYCATREQPSCIKAKLTRIIKILIESSIYQVIYSSMRYFPPKLFKRLATLFFKPDELEDLEELGVRNHLQFLVIELLKNDRFQELYDLIDWFFSSDEAKIKEFKTDFILSPLGLTFLFNLNKRHHSFDAVIFLFKSWLNCSIDSAALFQHRLSNFMKSEVDSERKIFDQNKGIKQIPDNQTSLYKFFQKCDLLKDLLLKKIDLEKSSKAVVDPKANQNSKKRVREDVPSQRKRLRICLENCD